MAIDALINLNLLLFRFCVFLFCSFSFDIVQICSRNYSQVCLCKYTSDTQVSITGKECVHLPLTPINM